MIEQLKTLCDLRGVSGDEDEVRAYLKTQATNHADHIRTDALGNLIVCKRGAVQAPDKLMICAHMDEVGIIVTSITDDGYLKFSFVGGVDRRVTIGKRVLIGPEKIPGVIGLKAYHLVSKEEEKKIPKTDSFYIDIGADSKEAAQRQVSLGEYGSFVSTTETFGDGLFKAKAIDDRLGCAIMLELLKTQLPMDITFVFTAQEEVGTRGAFGAAFSVKPEIALVLETTTAADIPSVSANRKVCHVGRGPVISYMDGATIYDRGLFEQLRAIAKQQDIPWQMKEYIAGGNDASAIQKTRDGVRVAAISAPVRYLHAPTSVGSISDFEHCLALTKHFIEDLAQQMQKERANS